MNKETFLSRLEQLLYDIPREEREEAMDYYRSYFEEAGEENEASVLEELDSPQEIAASIKADLKGPDSKAGRLKNPPQVRGMQKETHDSGEKPGMASVRQEPITVATTSPASLRRIRNSMALPGRTDNTKNRLKRKSPVLIWINRQN